MKKMKRILSFLLASAMVLSLCSCGKDETQDPNEPGSTPVVSSEEAKQYVFHGKDIDLGVDIDNVGLYGMVYMDGYVYTLVEDWNNQLGDNVVSEPLGSTGGASVVATASADVALSAAVGDGTINDVIEVLPEGDVEIWPEEEYVYTGPNYYIISAKTDGSDQKVTKLDVPRTGNGYSYLSSYTFMKDASFIGIIESYTEDYSDPNNPIFENVFNLYRWDKDGNLLWTIDMMPEDLAEGEYYYIYVRNFLDNSDGSVTMITGDNEVITISVDGTITDRYSLNDSANQNLGQFFTGKDGNLYVTSYGDDWMKVYFSTYDIKTGQLGEKKELPEALNSFSIYQGTTTDLLLTNSMGIYTYNIGDAEPKKIMDFINSDIATYGMNNIAFIDDKTFVANYNDAVDYKNHIALFTYVDPATIADKQIITLGCQYLGGDIKARVIDFNKTNNQYRIAVKAYGETGDYEQAITNMNNDIISGKMPDILVVETDQDISSWVNKGLLADIEALIAADPELSKQEYLENVWDAFSVNDKLYLVVPNFSVQTYAAKKSLVGDRNGWTMSEFQQFMKTMDPEMQPFGEMIRDSFMYYVMNYCGADFVDVNTGTCNFVSEEFIAMLEYAKTLPTEYASDYWDDYDYMKYESQYRDNRTLLMNIYISRIQDINYSINGYMGEEVTFVGFPGIEGNSSIIQPGSYMYAVSEKSANKQGAWDFVKYYLTPEYQNSDENWSLPVLKSAFETQAMKATEKPYWIDEEGNKVEYDDYFYLNGESIVIDRFTKAEVEAICEFIYSVNKRSYYNQEIINIVNEEAALFFDGQKSARDVAAVIQSRVQIYVDENQ